jgi:hypothetical protein
MAEQLNATCNSETIARAGTKSVFVDKQPCVRAMIAFGD